MAGLLRPAAGQILWDGRPIAEAPEAHAVRLHYLGHLDAVKPVLGVAENLRFWANLRGGAGASEAGLCRALGAFALPELAAVPGRLLRSEGPTSALQPLMRHSYAGFWLKQT